MKESQQIQIEFNRRKPLSKQEIPEVLCEEFAENTVDKFGHKVGYDPLHPKCMSCQAAMLCLEQSSYKPKEARIRLAKNALGVTYFYDENRVREEGQDVINKLYDALVYYKEKGVSIPIDKFDEGAKKQILSQMKSHDPVVLELIKEVLTKRGVIFTETEAKIP